MCILQSNIEPKDLIASLPHDVEALVLMSTESRKNVSGITINMIFEVSENYLIHFLSARE